MSSRSVFQKLTVTVAVQVQGLISDCLAVEQKQKHHRHAANSCGPKHKTRSYALAASLHSPPILAGSRGPCAVPPAPSLRTPSQMSQRSPWPRQAAGCRPKPITKSVCEMPQPSSVEVVTSRFSPKSPSISGRWWPELLPGSWSSFATSAPRQHRETCSKDSTVTLSSCSGSWHDILYHRSSKRENPNSDKPRADVGSPIGSRL